MFPRHSVGRGTGRGTCFVLYQLHGIRDVDCLCKLVCSAEARTKVTGFKRHENNLSAQGLAFCGPPLFAVQKCAVTKATVCPVL